MRGLRLPEDARSEARLQHGQSCSCEVHGGGQQQRPSTGKWYRGACMLDVGSKLPIIRWHNEGADSHEQVGSSTAEEYIRDLTEFWIPFFG